MIPSYPPRQWGLRMSGCEGMLENILRQSLALCSKNQCYTLVEVGSAGCTTLKAFKDIISEVRGSAPWRVVGFDLPVGKAWSLDMDEVQRNGVDQIISCPTVDIPAEQKMSLVLIDSPRLYIQDDFPFPISFVFIDASHGKSCGLDFLALEKKVSLNGIVVFHDYGEAEQGTDWQTVDREFINVRTYVHRLGLAEPCNERRKGWFFLAEIQGTRAYQPVISVTDNRPWISRVKDVLLNRRYHVTQRLDLSGQDGNSCAVIQRTGEPLEDQPRLSLD